MNLSFLKVTIVTVFVLFAQLTLAQSKGIETWNLNFGLGVEYFQEPYIAQAAIRGDDKIVVIQKSHETLPSAWLTTTWNIWGVNKPGVRDVKNTMFGFFAGIKVLDSNNSVFSGFSLGPQVSFVLASQVISLGGGWVTHRTKHLAQGIVEGQPLPAQYDDIEYEEKTENSYMLMMSISF